MHLTGSRERAPAGKEPEIASQIHWLAGIKAARGAVELLGKETVKDSPAYKLKVTSPTGESITYYLDAMTFLPAKTFTRMEAGERFMERERYFSDFKKTAGITFARSIENRTSGEYAGSSVKRSQSMKLLTIACSKRPPRKCLRK